MLKSFSEYHQQKEDLQLSEDIFDFYYETYLTGIPTDIIVEQVLKPSFLEGNYNSTGELLNEIGGMFNRLKNMFRSKPEEDDSYDDRPQPLPYADTRGFRPRDQRTVSRYDMDQANKEVDDKNQLYKRNLIRKQQAQKVLGIKQSMLKAVSQLKLWLAKQLDRIKDHEQNKNLSSHQREILDQFIDAMKIAGEKFKSQIDGEVLDKYYNPDFSKIKSKLPKTTGDSYYGGGGRYSQNQAKGDQERAAEKARRANFDKNARRL